MATGHALKRTERLDARLTREEKETIETAATLRGVSVTDFLRMSVKDAALQVIRENETLVLSERSRRVFVDLLLNSPKPNQKALVAAKRLRQEIG